MARSRVAERVRHGGHDIPRADIERRYRRSLENFLGEYVFLVDRAVCYLNAEREPQAVFMQQGPDRKVVEPDILRRLEAIRTHGGT